MHVRGAPRTCKEGTCRQRYPMRRTVVCYRYRRVIGRHMRTARNGNPAADGAATYIIGCAAYKDGDAVAIALQKWRACVGGCRAGRANVRSENTRAGVPNIPIVPNSPTENTEKPVGLFGTFRWTCVSRHPKNLDFPAPRNPHKKRARGSRNPKIPDSPSKNGKNPAIWTCAAPPMKSPKTRERQAFRGLPFRKWDVGNRKCAGFFKKRFNRIRKLRTLARGRHSRRARPSAGAPVCPALAGARSGSLLRRSRAPRPSDIHWKSSGSCEAA